MWGGGEEKGGGGGRRRAPVGKRQGLGFSGKAQPGRREVRGCGGHEERGRESEGGGLDVVLGQMLGRSAGQCILLRPSGCLGVGAVPKEPRSWARCHLYFHHNLLPPFPRPPPFRPAGLLIAWPSMVCCAYRRSRRSCITLRTVRGG